MKPEDPLREITVQDSLEHLRQRSGKLQEQRQIIADLLAKRKTLEQEEAEALAEFKSIFAPAMVELRPGIYAIIKPSKRRDINEGHFLGDTRQVYFKNPGRDTVFLTDYDDYIVFSESDGLPTPEQMEDPFLAEVFKELKQ
ncbi:MAG: hypothetical protein Q8Q10_00860 [bacterium]|nr:hypothetical protein [bacterium]